MGDDDGIPYVKLRALTERFDQWLLDHENFLRTSYSEVQLVMGLRQLLQTVDLDPQSFDLLMAISCAIEGRHTKFKLVHGTAPENGDFQIIKQHNVWAVSVLLVDEVDIAIANGEKTEATVAAAMKKYDLSREQVYRKLKEVRGSRALSLKAHRHVHGDNAKPLMGPEGYIVTEEGKLSCLVS